MTEKEKKIAELRKQLAKATDLKQYRSILGRIAGLSGDNQKKAEAGRKGGSAKRK